jgi:hypothetical protein
MKRDFKKFLTEFASDKLEHKEISFNEYNDMLENPNEMLEWISAQDLWMAAQKQFLKDLLDDMDDDIDKLFNRHDKARNEKAQLIVYIDGIKRYFHQKYLYLKRKK